MADHSESFKESDSTEILSKASKLICITDEMKSKYEGMLGRRDIEVLHNGAEQTCLTIPSPTKGPFNIKNPFIQDGVAFVTQGMKLDDMREILEQREAFRYKRELHESELMKTMGTYAPAFGMVGTLIGLVFMLFGMGKSDSGGGGGIDGIGPAMGVALITTFYGTILANLVFNPFAEKIKSRNKENVQCYQLMIEGICLLHQKKHPLDVRDKLTAYIPTELRLKHFKDDE